MFRQYKTYGKYSLRAAGRRANGENVIIDTDYIADIDAAVAIGIAGFGRVGRRAAFEDIIDNMDRVANVYISVAVLLLSDVIDYRMG